MTSRCCHDDFLDIEPKPFTEGEHLVETSGKMLILDVLLNYCQAKGHKVLLFSQMTKLLDIVQDILDLRSKIALVLKFYYAIF